MTITYHLITGDGYSEETFHSFGKAHHNDDTRDFKKDWVEARAALRGTEHETEEIYNILKKQGWDFEIIDIIEIND